MRWSPRSCVFRQAADIANYNLRGSHTNSGSTIGVLPQSPADWKAVESTI
jgi:hypothetical protein